MKILRAIAHFLMDLIGLGQQTTSASQTANVVHPPLIVDANGQRFIRECLISRAPNPTAATAAPTEDVSMSDTNQAAPAPTTNTSDPLLEKLKAVLTTAGHDVEKVWDEAVALAKKLV